MIHRLLHWLPPEAAHKAALRLLRLKRGAPHQIAPQRVFGLDFPNPVGLAAGFDKDGECVRGAFALGFGFVEIGSVTLGYRRGHPPPRLLRCPDSLLNRYGMPSAGMDRVAERLERLRRPLPGPLGISIKPDSWCAVVAKRLAPFADYFAINISCPAVKWRGGDLRRLLGGVRKVTDRPLLLKVGPVPPQEDDVLLADGLIVSNTRRVWDSGRYWGESGRPLMGDATATLRAWRERTDLPIIGVGGIMEGRDAAAKRDAGAALVQLYTGLVYRGPKLIREAAESWVDPPAEGA